MHVRADRPRHDVVAEVGNESLGAAHERVGDPSFVALPVNASGVQACVRLQLDRVFARRRHLRLMKGGNVREESRVIHVALRKARHSMVDIV